MTQETPRAFLRLLVLAAVLVVNVVSSWYPFAFELPERIANSAQRQPDGSWDLDDRSRVTAYAPDIAPSVMATGRFRLTLEAKLALPHQSGPARLFATGDSPYDASFMAGIDDTEFVLRLPCSGAAAGIDAEWRVPIPDRQAIVISAVFSSSDDGLSPTLQVGDEPMVHIRKACPEGTSPQLPDGVARWTLGNVSSGHRPFVGRLVRLELDGPGQHVDLLRDIHWQVPSRFWRWPGRVYQPADKNILQSIWHFVSFVPLGHLAGTAIQSMGYPRLLIGILAFSTVVNGGKLLFAGRHASLLDVLFNLAGAVAGIAACPRRNGIRLRRD
jgi:VanZ family protein